MIRKETSILAQTIHWRTFAELEAETMRTYFHPITHELRTGTDKPESIDDVAWRTLPHQVGIYWHDDQSQNQLVLYWGNRPSPDYVFNPSEDLELLREHYLDQLVDLF